MIPLGILTQQHLLEADPYFANVTLLLHGNGLDSISVINDYSLSEQRPIASGPALDTAEKKFGDSSIWFDNVGDYVTIPYVDVDFDWEFADHTIEFWVKPFGGSWAGWESTSGRPIVIGRMHITNSSVQWEFGILDSGQLTFTYNNGAAIQLETVATVPTSGWSHCAMCNDGGTIKLFINGILELSEVIDGTPATTSDDLHIGRGYNSVIHGWLDDIRITSGVARYTDDFTVPSAEFYDEVDVTIDPDTDLDFASVKLLLHMDGADTSTTFDDDSTPNHTITPSGNAQIDTDKSHSGGAAGLFDGTGDYLSVPYVTGDFDWFVEDYTVEFWCYASSWTNWDDGRSPAHSNVIGRTSATSTTDYWNFGPIDDGRLHLRYYNGSTIGVYSINTLPLDQWNHCAMVVKDGYITLFINGEPEVIAAIAGSPQSVSQNLTIGSNNGNAIDGWLDDIRITRGVARYVHRFTPLSTAFPNSA